MGASRPLTIVFQAFATSWLGHTSRLMAIAQAIRRREPEPRLIFLVEGNLAGPLLESAGFAHISLPAEAMYAGPEWSGWPGDQRDRMLGEMTRTLLEQLEPNLVIYDSRPCAYVVEQTERIKMPTVFIARRTRTAVRSIEWAMAHREFVDLVIIPHDRGEIPVPAELADRTHCVGTIVRDLNIEQVATPNANKRVLITGGGGGFPGTGDFYNHALAAFATARDCMPALQGILVTGPMFREWGKLKPVDGVTIVPFDADLGTSMAAVDLVICQAGYNTIAELGEIGTPTICVPAPRIADDQFARAAALLGQRSGFVAMDGATVEAMCDQIIASLAAPHAKSIKKERPPGADRAAELILSLCA